MTRHACVRCRQTYGRSMRGGFIGGSDQAARCSFCSCKAIDRRRHHSTATWVPCVACSWVHSGAGRRFCPTVFSIHQD